MSSRIDVLKKTVSQESMAEMISAAKRHEQPGCSCPSCGASMSILKVSAGKRHVEIDVCGSCRTIWYDKGEFEALVPQDGLLSATVTAGKAYRRETVLAVVADLRSGHLKVLNKKSLETVLRVSYHVPLPDVSPIISTLQSQRVIQINNKTGAVTVVRQTEPK
jgi:Zn-finger nucleic acid-binding protein